MGTLLAALADVLLDSARGNSGAIVAQFFQGMSDSAGDITRFTTYTFGKAVSLGSDYAHDALSQPREGTILSVIAAFAESIAHEVGTKSETEFPHVMETSLQRVDEALANTPNQLDVLRKAGVVDSGAKGFAEIVAGMAEYVQDGTMAPMPAISIAHEIEPAVEFSEADNESQYRFCTECIVTAPDINRRKLREALSELGDSLVLAGTKRKAKIHIHVDEPEQVFDAARQYGDLSAEKADDMHRQQHATHNQKRRFAVITDSGADISDADMERLAMPTWSASTFTWCRAGSSSESMATWTRSVLPSTSFMKNLKQAHTIRRRHNLHRAISVVSSSFSRVTLMM
jgi:dihydroxyacetone kinase-like predicted kinase